MNSKITNANKKTFSVKELQVLRSTLWVIVMFNMLSADILSYMVPGALAQIMTGYAEETKITNGFLLIGAIFMEVPIAMIFLSMFLKGRADRWVNSIAGVITIVFILAGGSTKPTYIFFAVFNIVNILLIALLVLRLPSRKMLQMPDDVTWSPRKCGLKASLYFSATMHPDKSAGITLSILKY